MSDNAHVLWNDEELITFAEANADAASSWHPIVPIGKYRHPKFGMVEFTASDVREFAEHWRAKTRGYDIGVTELEGHERTPHGESYGWLKDVEERGDGLWGKIDWTDLGAAAVQKGHYKYISPTLHTRELPWTAADGSKVSNVINGICLTNRPVFHHQPALSVNMSEYAAVDNDKQEDNTMAGGENNMETEQEQALDAAEAEVADETTEATEPAVDAAEVEAPAEETVTASEEPEPEASTPDEPAEPTVDFAEELQKRDAELAKVNAELEAAKQDGLKLAELSEQIAELTKSNELAFAENTFRGMEFSEGATVAKMAESEVDGLATMYLALPETIREEFVAFVQRGGPMTVPMGEQGAFKPTDVPNLRKKIEKLRKEQPDEWDMTDKTITAVAAFGETNNLEDPDAAFAKWTEAGKPAAPRDYA